ncbi:MAG: ATP synthase F1 subunit epsilon [Microcoleaceae cyanobacterium]
MVLNVRVIAPNRTIWDDEAEEVILPSTTGQLGILSGHAPMMTALDTGVMQVRKTGNDSSWVPIVLFGGFAEIDENEITVLVNGAESAEGIDLETARAEYDAAQSKFMTSDDSTPSQDQIKAKNELKRARARFQAAGGMS